MLKQWQKDAVSFRWNKDGTMTQETASMHLYADHRHSNTQTREWQRMRESQYRHAMAGVDYRHSTTFS